jgi:hypothetical protein
MIENDEESLTILYSRCDLHSRLHAGRLMAELRHNCLRVVQLRLYKGALPATYASCRFKSSFCDCPCVRGSALLVFKLFYNPQAWPCRVTSASTFPLSEAAVRDVRVLILLCHLRLTLQMPLGHSFVPYAIGGDQIVTLRVILEKMALASDLLPPRLPVPVPGQRPGHLVFMTSFTRRKAQQTWSTLSTSLAGNT